MKDKFDLVIDSLLDKLAASEVEYPQELANALNVLMSLRLALYGSPDDVVAAVEKNDPFKGANTT